jgi:DNA-binding transcriptional MerR regulator
MDEFKTIQSEALLEAYEDGDLGLDNLIDELKELGLGLSKIKSLLKKKDLFDEDEWELVIW